MVVRKIGDIWTSDCTYAERLVVKDAGWWWHPRADCGRSRCGACANGHGKGWWTPFLEKARLLAQYADESASGLREEQARAEKSLEASKAVESDAVIPAPPGRAYRPFQRAGVEFIRARKSALLADDMGVGKTIQALGLVNVDESIHRVLVICPATVKRNWAIEAGRWLTRPFQIHVVGGTKSSAWDDDANFVIMNYDIIAKHAEAIRRKEWDLLIVDESHYLKNPKALRTKNVVGSAPRDKKRIPPIPARRRLAMTGTPVVNRPLDLWPVLHWLDSETWDNFFRFAKRYCGAVRNRWGWDFSGATNLGELQERLRSTIMIRRRKENVLAELPPKIHQIIELPANGAQKVVRAEMDAFTRRQSLISTLRLAVEEAAHLRDEGAHRAALKDLRAEQSAAFAEMSALRKAVAISKIPHVLSHLRDCLDSGAKIVVFAHHHEVVDAIKAEFQDICVVVDGRVPTSARAEAVRKFQEDAGARLFIGGIRAASEGITLTASSHVVFAETDWTPGKMVQAADRCHRIGQANSVLIQHLVLQDSLDAYMAQTVGIKSDVIDSAMDGDIPEHVIPEPPVRATTDAARVKINGLRPGGYAIDTRDGEKNKTAFYRLQQSARGWWFLGRHRGPETNRVAIITPRGEIRGQTGARDIIERIQADPRGAMERYGRELGVCGNCGKRLTNDESRALGIGPVCAGKLG